MKHIVCTFFVFLLLVSSLRTAEEPSVIILKHDPKLNEHRLAFEYWINSAVFSPDGKKVVTASSDGTARIWDAKSGKELIKLPTRPTNWKSYFARERPEIASAQFSPDGKKIITVNFDGVGQIFDAESGETLTMLRGHTTDILSTAFSPNSEKIVTTGFGESAVRIWDPENGKELQKLEGHTSGVLTAVFSPDGKKVVTASADQTARIWDAESGKILQTLEGHSDEVKTAVFSSDGKKVVTTSYDATARIWLLE